VGKGKGNKPFVMAPALLIRLTGGLSLPSLCHGVLACSSFACPIALSIWELNSSSCLSALFWCNSFARAAKSSFLDTLVEENARIDPRNSEVEGAGVELDVGGLLRKVERI
jgi:hypothetical protein